MRLSPVTRIALGLAVLILLASGIAFYALPEGATVGIHFDVRGRIDRWVEKSVGLAIMPALGLAVVAGLLIRLRGVEDRSEARQTAERVSVALLLTFFLLDCAIIASGFGRWNVTVTEFLPLAGLCCVVGGLLLGATRPNSLVGLRAPWTRSTEEAWIKTHAALRVVIVSLGLVLFVASFLGLSRRAEINLTLGLFGACSLAVLAWSYWKFGRGHFREDAR